MCKRLHALCKSTTKSRNRQMTRQGLLLKNLKTFGSLDIYCVICATEKAQ